MDITKLRYPDKPVQIYSLKMVKEGDYLAQPKLDGHNALIIKDAGKIVVISRHMKKLPVTPEMLKRLERYPLEDGTVLNAEWTSRRKAFKEEQIWFFDIMYQRGEWVGIMPVEQRYGMVSNIFDQVKADGAEWPVRIVPTVDNGYAKLYKSCVDDMVTEGIVLKRKGSKLIGGLKDSINNPAMFKMKWRDGADGLSRTIVSDENLVTEA